ncbi:MAG: hypothetical protein L0Y50_06495 [Beijerinckiaceae bacterium]|nr:hypothetical protein [Beijerinckiaceae bacterium]MCI0735907.1 hypothetical protein [Beijerinckiaceae bacterium]
MNEPPFVQVTVEPPASRKRSFLTRNLPYAAMLLLTILGVAYTGISRQPLAAYWEVLAVAAGVTCAASAWPRTSGKQARLRLIWKQAVHWAAILAAMNIVLLPNVQRMLTAPASSLMLLLLLALGTFLAGINTSPRIGFLGLAMALAVPAIASLEKFALLLFLAGVAILGLGIAFWRR